MRKVYDPKMRFRSSWVALLTLTAACAPTAPATQPPAAPPPAAVTSASTPSPAIAAPPPSAPPPANIAAGRPCGALACRAFATPAEAFDVVLQTNPRVLAVGEAHAQDDTPGIKSATRRFAEELLPKLAGKSKHLVIELLFASCKKETTSEIEKQVAPVTEHQAKSNQNQFVTLGKVAGRLGIEPQGLTPDCAEYEAAVSAGEDGLARLLTLVADQTAKELETLLAKPETAHEILLSYGGALHNDLEPRPGQEAWSFGPRLATATQDRYVELDLIVPEFVKDSEAWRNLPWFAAFDREHLSDETLLYRTGEHSFVLVFPKTAPSASPR